MAPNESIDLSEVPGLGPVRRAALAAAGVHDLEGLLAMRVAELAAVRGIGIWQARKIREFLRQRGLVLAGEDGDGAAAVMLRSPTDGEVQVLSASIHALERQADVEARMQAEVEALAAAVAEAQVEEAAASAKPSKGSDTSDRSSGSGAKAAATAEREPPPDWSRTLSEQRERLPEVALELMEAIRQAAVDRQLTRLLIIAGEFVSDTRPVDAADRKRAAEALAEAEGLLQRAIDKRRFSQKEQQDLAGRLRRRRQGLERILKNAGAGE